MQILIIAKLHLAPKSSPPPLYPRAGKQQDGRGINFNGSSMCCSYCPNDLWLRFRARQGIRALTKVDGGGHITESIYFPLHA